MKYIGLVILFLLSSLILQAGNPGPGKDYLYLGQKLKSIQGTQARPNIPGNLFIEVGFNFQAGAPDTLDVGWWGSKTVNIYYFREFKLGNGGFSFSPGIGLGLEKYSFDEPITLDPGAEDGIVDLSQTLPNADIRKSKLAANFIDIPILFMYHTNEDNFQKGFHVGIGGRVGLLLNSHTKLKYRMEGQNQIVKNKVDYNLSKFRYGIIGRLGVGIFQVSYYYNLNEFYQAGQGPFETDHNTHSLTLGINFF